MESALLDKLLQLNPVELSFIIASLMLNDNDNLNIKFEINILFSELENNIGRDEALKHIKDAQYKIIN